MNLEELLKQAIEQFGDSASALAEIKKLLEKQEGGEPEDNPAEPPANDNDPLDPNDGEGEPNGTEPEDNMGATDDDDKLDRVLSLLEDLSSRVEALEGGNKTTDNDDTKTDDEPKEPNAEGMDMAAVTKAVAKRLDERNAMAAKVTPFIGSFDVNAMDSADAVAAYACKKLNLKTAKGFEQATITGYLANREPVAKQAKMAFGQDAAPTSGKSFLTGQINK